MMMPSPPNHRPQLIERILIAADDDQSPTFLREFFRRAGASAAVAAGNDDGLLLEAPHEILPNIAGPELFDCLPLPMRCDLGNPAYPRWSSRADGYCGASGTA
jgi:hypothetical protein